MGLFTVVIDEMEDLLNGVLSQVDVSEQVKTGVQSLLDSVIGADWQGEGADAFYGEASEFVVQKLEEILGFSTDFTKGIKNTIEYLRMLDDLLSGLFGF